VPLPQTIDTLTPAGTVPETQNQEIPMFNKALCVAAVSVFALAAHAAESSRSYLTPEGYNPATSPPFSNGVMVGETFYVAGHLGIDPATGQAAADVGTEARLVMEQVKTTLQRAGLTMDDLVSVTIYCTDLSLYDPFNAVYRSYFHGNFPARAFIGASKLVRGAHFEIQGVAVKSPGPSAKK
jgi:2-iminobutanoate/2-iminopropanoate deaminase